MDKLNLLQNNVKDLHTLAKAMQNSNLSSESATSFIAGMKFAYKCVLELIDNIKENK